MGLIERAEEFATAAHLGQPRKWSKEPYICHPRRVAEAAAALGMSEEAIAAAWLHDVLEDCKVSLKKIIEEFGPRVGKLVFLLSDLRSPAVGNRAMRKALYLDDLAGSDDAEVHTLKMLDACDNAPSIRAAVPKFWLTYSKEVRSYLTRLFRAHPRVQQRLKAILLEEITP